MTRRRLRALTRQGEELRAVFASVRDAQGVPREFPAEVLQQAAEVAGAPVPAVNARPDARNIPFVTIDPAGSTDLDQAVHIARRGSGFRVHYAIADVAAFVRPGSVLDLCARERGVTLYSPDLRTPLHPPVLSEDATSLLPDVDRPAVLWRIDLDESGLPTCVDVERSVIRSRAKLTYRDVQDDLDNGTAGDALVCLREVGKLRQSREIKRGGIDVRVPDQEIEPDGPGYRLVSRAPHEVEGWNAQISLLTGMSAAQIMLDGGVGIVRVMPPPGQADYDRLRHTAQGLGLQWPADVSYAAYVRDLDPHVPVNAAFLGLVTVLLRSAGYKVIDTAVGDSVPPELTHAAVAAPYTHVTAPLRRLVDRFGTECVLAVAGGTAVPEWVSAALPQLPDLMRSADQRSRALERATLDAVEAVLLAPYVGRDYDAVVVDNRRDYDVVQLRQPAVRAHTKGGPLALGSRVRVRLTAADPKAGTVEFVAI